MVVMGIMCRTSVTVALDACNEVIIVVNSLYLLANEVTQWVRYTDDEEFENGTLTEVVQIVFIFLFFYDFKRYDDTSLFLKQEICTKITTKLLPHLIDRYRLSPLK